MLAWGDRWHAKGVPLILTHKTCGNDFQPTIICDRCRKPIDAAAMRYRLNYNPAVYGAGGPRNVLSEDS
jgi:hypothetical protein